MAERVTNSCVCRLRSHALSGVLRRHPVSGLVDVWLIGKIQCSSDDEIPVGPMESSQCDSCSTLVIHRSSNSVLHRLPRPLIVEGPGHPALQIWPRVFLGALNRIQIAKRWRTQDQAWRYDGHRMTHPAATLNFRGLVKPEEFAGRAQLQEFAASRHLAVGIPEVKLPNGLVVVVPESPRPSGSAPPRERPCGRPANGNVRVARDPLGAGKR